MTDLCSSGVAEAGPVNILMVDHRPGNLLGYQSILEELGENLLTASSARAALDVLLHQNIALLLVDVMIPDLDGFDLLEMIRAHPRFEQTAVILVSGMNGKHLDRIQGYSARAVDYISLPVVPELLRAKVRVFADLYRKTRQLECLTREFEARIEVRTAEVEAAGRRVFATLAHEIRNPLAPILNCVRLLKSSALEPAAVLRNQTILERQLLHLVRLVDDLVDESPSARRSGPETVAEIPFVAVDSVRMAEVLSSILDDATTSTPTGDRILIGLSKDNAELVLRIADSGTGIASPPAEDPSMSTTERAPIRFLTIDDNVVHADTLAELLERSGCRARATYTGEEAMRVGEELEPDIVLLDLVMPTMDGFEAAKRLRETPWGSRAKLVAITGWLASDRQMTADAGFDGHLVKPVDFDVVLKLVDLVES
jgi:CheY-like chemotaxis protein